MKRAGPAFAASFIAVCAATDAMALSGAELNKFCLEKTDISCPAYVRGFLDGMVIGRYLGKEAPTKYCPPKEGVTLEQGRFIVQRYFKAHPDKLQSDAGFLAATALIETYPCAPH